MSVKQSFISNSVKRFKFSGYAAKSMATLTLCLLFQAGNGQNIIGFSTQIARDKIGATDPQPIFHTNSSNLLFGLSYRFQLNDHVFLGTGFILKINKHEVRFPNSGGSIAGSGNHSLQVPINVGLRRVLLDDVLAVSFQIGPTVNKYLFERDGPTNVRFQSATDSLTYSSIVVNDKKAFICLSGEIGVQVLLGQILSIEVFSQYQQGFKTSSVEQVVYTYNDQATATVRLLYKGTFSTPLGLRVLFNLH
jgi:hypothetical protein